MNQAVSPAAAHGPVAYLRSALFNAGMVVSVSLVSILVLLAWPLPHRLRYRIATSWNRFVLWWLAVTCNLRYTVEGREHVPPGPAIVFCKHQSSFETILMPILFPPQTWVLKRELLPVPFFGWAMATMKPIAVQRGGGRRAVTQLVEQGRERLAEGLWVVIYPEGTRVPVGVSVRYKKGGAVLAQETGYPVVPVAHNAGLFWPRRSFLKRPGVIRVCIGPPIDTRGLTADEINERAREWMERKTAELL